MSLGMQLLACAERRPDAEAVVEGEERLDYSALAAKVSAVAGGLHQLGVGQGDAIAVALRNRADTVVLYWAAQWLGAWFVPVNWRLTAGEIQYCVHDAGARVFAYEGVSEQAGAGLGDEVSLVAVADATIGVPFGELAVAPRRPEPARVEESSPALMLYTSGTTGQPKGVPRSQLAEWSAALAHAVQCRYSLGERTLGVMPFYHTMGMRSLLSMAVVDGCLVVEPAFRAAAALDVVQAEAITALYLAPTLFHDLVVASRDRPSGAPSVAKLAYAGAPMTGALVRACQAAFAPRVFVNHYGSTEVYTFSVHPDQVAKPGCAGRPGVHARLRLVPPGDQPDPHQVVAPGEAGQIACHSSSLEAFAGYWHRPDADERAIRDGWYLTGDLGRLDGDGDLWVLGRVDDMIISGGENVFPLEVENVLATHPKVYEVAVVGLPDERLGAKVVACVVGQDDLDAGALDAHCLASGALAPFKRPREYRFVKALPRNAAGKLMKRALQDDLAGQDDVAGQGDVAGREEERSG